MTDNDGLADDTEDEKPAARSARPVHRTGVTREGTSREGAQRGTRRRSGERSVFDLPEDLRAQIDGRGLSSEFKRTSYFGKEEDPDYFIDLSENGWEPLSLKSFPDFAKLMPKGWTKDTFEKRGQILMIRPVELTREARREEEQKAVGQVKGQLATLKESGPGEAARTLAKVNRSYESGKPIE